MKKMWKPLSDMAVNRSRSVVKSEFDRIEFRQDKKSHHAGKEDNGEKQKLVNQPLLRTQVHEDQSHQARFKRRDEKSDENVERSHSWSPEVKLGHHNGYAGKNEQDAPNQKVELLVFADFFWTACHTVKMLEER